MLYGEADGTRSRNTDLEGLRVANYTTASHGYYESNIDSELRRIVLFPFKLYPHKRTGQKNHIFSHDCCSQNMLSPPAKRFAVRWYSREELNFYLTELKSVVSANWTTGAYNTRRKFKALQMHKEIE